jgi:hypothetical protein
MKNIVTIIISTSIFTGICSAIINNRTTNKINKIIKNKEIIIDSLNLQIKNKKDSINMLNDYIIFLENDNQFLGSILAEKELEDGIE